MKRCENQVGLLLEDGVESAVVELVCFLCDTSNLFFISFQRTGIEANVVLIDK